MPESEIADAVFTLERLRAVKTAEELRLLRQASEGVVDAMLAVFPIVRPGQTKREVVEALRREETMRGLLFEYCLTTAGKSFNRAPSDQVLEEGDIMSLDSAATTRAISVISAAWASWVSLTPNCVNSWSRSMRSSKWRANLSGTG